MAVQPQLVLLQKTLFYIESLGRKLYPTLDLWATAKPFITKWMQQQRSPRRLLKLFLKDFRGNAEKMAQLPELLYAVLLKLSRS